MWNCSVSSPLLARFLALPNAIADRLPPFTRRLAVASHAAFAALAVLFGRPTACRASFLVSLFAYRGCYPVAIRKRDKLSWGHARICRAVRKHLGATGEWMRLRLHSADSTLPRLWPTSSSSGSPPLTTARQFSSCPSDSASRRTPCPPRLVSGPARHYPRSLGYGPLHLGTRGTSTLPIRALPSAHYALC